MRFDCVLVDVKKGNCSQKMWHFVKLNLTYHANKKFVPNLIRFFLFTFKFHRNEMVFVTGVALYALFWSNFFLKDWNFFLFSSNFFLIWNSILLFALHIKCIKHFRLSSEIFDLSTCQANLNDFRQLNFQNCFFFFLPSIVLQGILNCFLFIKEKKFPLVY